MRLSSRAAAATESPTLALSAKMKAMKAAGEPVIGFAAGEPDFDTPAPIKDAAKRALDEGFTKYCPASGTLSLRQAVAKKTKQDQGLDYDAKQVIVSVGGKNSLYLLLQTVVDPGDVILLPAPYWVSYVDMTRLAGGVTVTMPTTEETGLKITPEQLRATLEQYPYAKGLILNSPSNPTGVMYDESEIRALAEVLVDYPDVLVISDDIYEHLVYDGRKHFSIARVDGFYDRTAIVSGASKAYSMTGWRVGWVLGPGELIEAMGRIQSHATSGTASIAQAAAEEAVTMDQSPVEEMRQAFDERRRVMVDGLRAIDGITCAEPQGAFYAFPNIGGLLRDGETAADFAAALLEAEKVGVVPGEDFGAPQNIRLSYATSMDDIKQGLERIGRYARKLNGA